MSPLVSFAVFPIFSLPFLSYTRSSHHRHLFLFIYIFVCLLIRSRLNFFFPFFLPQPPFWNIPSRKAKYCSKSCQSKAWAEGHRWWCIERHHSTHPPNATTTSSTTAAATAAVVAAAPDTTTPQANQVVPLATHGTTADVLPIPIDERQSDLPQGQQQGQQDPAAAQNTDDPATETGESEENRHAMAFNTNASSDTDSNTHTPHHQDSSLLRSGHHHHHHHHHHRRRNSRTAPSVPSGSSTEVETEITDNNVMRDLMDID